MARKHGNNGVPLMNEIIRPMTNDLSKETVLKAVRPTGRGELHRKSGSGGSLKTNAGTVQEILFNRPLSV
jgi:hypothetical protein